MTTDVDRQGDLWNPHNGLRVPEIANLRCDILLRSGDVVLWNASIAYSSKWHWSDGSTDPNDIVAYRLV